MCDDVRRWRANGADCRRRAGGQPRTFRSADRHARCYGNSTTSATDFIKRDFTQAATHFVDSHACSRTLRANLCSYACMYVRDAAPRYVYRARAKSLSMSDNNLSYVRTHVTDAPCAGCPSICATKRHTKIFHVESSPFLSFFLSLRPEWRVKQGSKIKNDKRTDWQIEKQRERQIEKGWEKKRDVVIINSDLSATHHTT